MSALYKNVLFILSYLVPIIKLWTLYRYFQSLGNPKTYNWTPKLT